MEGNCKCGQINYKADKVLKLVNCHCNLCRNMNGTAFSSYVVVAEDSFVIENGQSLLGAYTATELATKYFCTNCGTPIYNANPTTYPGLAMLYLGTVRDHASISPDANIYCTSKLGWFDSANTLPSFNGGPQRN